MSDKPKRPYTMTVKALNQRREASKKSTGPRTDAGKAASSRNAWKTGDYSAVNNEIWLDAGLVKGKPCQTTCSKYPCSLVTDEITKEGGDCLDKTVYITAFDNLIEAMNGGDPSAVNSLLAMNMAGGLETLALMREEIAANGIMIEKPIFNKEGGEIGTNRVPHPMLPIYIKTLEKLGINLNELQATPKAANQLKDQETAEDAMASMMQGIARLAGGLNNNNSRGLTESEDTE